jgi:hypothetical protein
MKNTRLSAWIIGGILILLLIYFISTYNKLVGKEEKLKLQWNEVQNAYQRRLDLIPNLVNVVKGGADYEQTTLQKLTEARAKAAAKRGPIVHDLVANDLVAAEEPPEEMFTASSGNESSWRGSASSLVIKNYHLNQ